MFRCRPVLATLLIPLVAVAAPVPKPPSKKIEDVFGTVVATKGVVCEMTPRGELRIGIAKETPSEGEALSVARPLVTRKIRGDFEVTVRVAHAPPDDKDLSVVGDGDPTVSAGIGLYPPDDPKQAMTFLQQHVRDGKTWKSDIFNRTQYNDTAYESVRRPGGKLDREPIYLRLTRRGDDFTSAWSFDGKKWTPAASQGRFKFGLEVLVGPVAAHNTTAAHVATFDGYALESPKPEEKK